APHIMTHGNLPPDAAPTGAVHGAEPRGSGDAAHPQAGADRRGLAPGRGLGTVSAGRGANPWPGYADDLRRAEDRATDRGSRSRGSRSPEEGQSPEVTVACVYRTGGIYNREWVRALKRGLDLH